MACWIQKKKKNRQGKFIFVNNYQLGVLLSGETTSGTGL